MLSAIRLGLLILSALMMVAGATFYVLTPESLMPTPAGSPISTASAIAHSPPQTPGNPSEAIRPTEAPTEAPTRSPEPSGGILVPTAVPVPSFIPIPTVQPPSLPPLGPGCYRVKVTANTPTGIAGCIRFGVGTASYYSPLGVGAAMNFCTWTLRHTEGCGTVKVTALSTGISVRIPVVDFCDCYTGTDRERIIDLQGGVLPLLSLNPAEGLWRVEVSR